MTGTDSNVFNYGKTPTNSVARFTHSQFSHSYHNALSSFIKKLKNFNVKNIGKLIRH